MFIIAPPPTASDTRQRSAGQMIAQARHILGRPLPRAIGRWHLREGGKQRYGRHISALKHVPRGSGPGRPRPRCQR